MPSIPTRWTGATSRTARWRTPHGPPAGIATCRSRSLRPVTVTICIRDGKYDHHKDWKDDKGGWGDQDGKDGKDDKGGWDGKGGKPELPVTGDSVAQTSYLGGGLLAAGGLLIGLSRVRRKARLQLFNPYQIAAARREHSRRAAARSGSMAGRDTAASRRVVPAATGHGVVMHRSGLVVTAGHPTLVTCVFPPHSPWVTSLLA